MDSDVVFYIFQRSNREDILKLKCVSRTFQAQGDFYLSLLYSRRLDTLMGALNVTCRSERQRKKWLSRFVSRGRLPRYVCGKCGRPVHEILSCGRWDCRRWDEFKELLLQMYMSLVLLFLVHFWMV